VTRINPTADPTTRQVRIYASIPNAGRTLVGGLFANGRMSSTTKTGLIVPTAAVDVRGAAPVAMRIKQGKVEKVQVRVGITDKASESVEIIAGLQAGDTLLLGAAQGITPGTLVKITPAARPVATSGD
jgi:multidrug efflux pump subunit AcrA (membrane-fusion protein)